MMPANNDAPATAPVTSLDKARPFYEDVLGPEPVGGGGEPSVRDDRAGPPTA